jgi:serine/threonine protein kinase
VAEIIRFDPGDGPRPDNGDAALDAALVAADQGMLAAISSNLDLDGGLDRILENPPPHAAGRFSAGSQMAGYRLEERIGRGGMAQVFRARDERLDRQVALKILGPELAEDPVFRERFIRESRAAAAVQHPHIIPVFEAGEASSVLFIAMPLIDGGDAGSFVRRNGPLPPARAAEIVSQVASALDAAHAKGLVHRDVKPANMLLDARPGLPDHVYLSDFGLTKAPQDSGGLTAAGQFLGTADYAAPEQVSDQPVDGRTDQYALGCSAFELLCGEPPFRREQVAATVRAHLAGPPPLATSQLPGLPSEVDRVFARVLARSPADRYDTCQEFAEALRRALGLRPYAADPGGTPQERPANPVCPERATDPLNEPAAPRNGVSPAISGDTRPLDPADNQVRGAEVPSAASAIKKVPAPAGPTKRKRGKRRRLTPALATVIAAVILAVGTVAGVVISQLLSHGSTTPGHSQTPIAATSKSATPSTHPTSAPTNIGHIVEWANSSGQNTSWLVGSNGERYWIPTAKIFYCLVNEGHTDLGPQSSTVLDSLPDSGQWASCPATVNRAAYIGHIVEWANGSGQNTSWLVGSNGERYWIPSTSIFFCLRNEGHTDLGPQSSSVLDDLPDLGQRASCP